VNVSTLSQRSAAVTLVGIAGLHGLWAGGSAWPAPDRDTLANVVAGRDGGAVRSAAACVSVAALLAIAAAFVAGQPRRLPQLQRTGTGAAGVAVALAVRGSCGLAGRTDRISPGSTSPRFRQLDRRYYSPLCLSLAAAAASSTTSR
jgi:hypothetical protein